MHQLRIRVNDLQNSITQQSSSVYNDATDVQGVTNHTIKAPHGNCEVFYVSTPVVTGRHPYELRTYYYDRCYSN